MSWHDEPTETDYARAQYEEQKRHNNEMSWAVAIGFFFLIYFLVPEAKANAETAFYWIAGIALVVGFFAWSGLRTFLLGGLGAFAVWAGPNGGDMQTAGLWLLGAAFLNSAFAQWRKHGWNVKRWWDLSAEG